MKEEYFENGKVICQHCKKSFNIISPTHLKKEHASTIEKYKEEFPNAPLSSQQFKAKQKFHAAELFKEKTLGGKTEEEFFEELTLKKEDEKKNEDEILKNLKKEIDANVLLKEIKFKDKLDFYLCIKNRYPGLKNNYFIEISSLNGIVTYSTITDMADPINKIDFEFPNTFWHNENRGHDPMRNKKLEQFGWKVCVIPGYPSITDIENILNGLGQ